jgi:endonuclease/exonuclease/phosphatase family metal-dependent hydrolase
VVPARGHGKEFLEMSTRSPRRRWIWALAAICAGASLAVPAAASAKPTNVKVMSRNLYLGADLAPALLATTQVELFEEAFNVTDAVRETNFTARARLLAAEIAAERPHLIGLQEVALWRRTPAGQSDGNATPATQVVYDFLRTLQRRLAQRGMRYTVAVKQREADIEAPIDEGFDVRLTMHDVILVRKRKDLKVTKRLSDNYNADIAVPTPAGELTSTRGWTAIDGRFKGRKFRFVNTHLEAAGDDTRDAQARELIARSGPVRRVRGKPVIVLGDMNSDPNGTESTAGAVNILKGAGLRDLWPRIERRDDGFSCCLNNSNMSDTTAEGFDHRIDLIFSKPALRGSNGRVVGDRVSDRAANGLWPSDHAGVVLTLRLPK